MTSTYRAPIVFARVKAQWMQLFGTATNRDFEVTLYVFFNRCNEVPRGKCISDEGETHGDAESHLDRLLRVSAR